MTFARSNMDGLAASLERSSRKLAAQGEILWQRVHDWQRMDTGPSEERGGGLGEAAPEDEIAERQGDARASRYCPEVIALLDRMAADSARLERLFDIVCPQQPKKLTNKDMLAAQVAAEGWCVSCNRDDGYLEPVHRGYYKDACRACGEWKAAHNGEAPPLQVVRWRHRHPGKRVPVSVVEASGR